MRRRDFLRRAGIGAAGAAALVVLDPFARVAGAVGPGGVGPLRRTVCGMGTWIHLTAVPDGTDGADASVDAALGEVAEVDRLMSAHRADSDLSRIHLAAGGMARVDARTLAVAEAGLAYAEMTGGALDPTVLPLMRFWGFMGQRDVLPRPGDLGPVLERVGYRQALIRDGQVGLRQAGGELDFGGIAKGYGVDRAVAQLRRGGVVNAFVEAGGDLYAAGQPDPTRRWRVGIRDPRRPDRLFATLEVKDEAVATSGGYEKFRVVGGRRVAHLIDPRTGQPAEEVLSATVLAPTAMEADALATATYILGVRAGLDLVRQRPGVEGVWVTADGLRWVSPGLTGRIRWV